MKALDLKVHHQVARSPDEHASSQHVDDEEETRPEFSYGPRRGMEVDCLHVGFRSFGKVLDK